MAGPTTMIGMTVLNVMAFSTRPAMHTLASRGPRSFGSLRAHSSMSLDASAFEAVVNARYACKVFDSGKPIPGSLLKKVLEVTQRTPTSFNTQPWLAIVVRSEEAKTKLMQAMPDGNKPKVESAPATVVFAADMQPEKLLSKDAPDFIKQFLPVFVGQCSTPEAWAFKQTAFAAQTFMLAAAAHGLQTCPMEGFTSIDDVCEAVGLDKTRYSVPVVIPIGYETTPRDKTSPRFDFSAQIFEDSMGTPFDDKR